MSSNNAQVSTTVSCDAVLVTYHPNWAVLAEVLEAVAGQVDRIVLRDNGSDEGLACYVSGLPCSSQIDFLAFNRNCGVAYAQNRGLEAVLTRGTRYALILDQDSVPAAGMVSHLRAAMQAAEEQGYRPAAAGPRYIDPRTGRESFFLALGGWRFRKRECGERAGEKIVRPDWLISSGMLISMEALRAIGLMNESLFIDDVDTEWCLRARSLGYTVIGACGALMNHTLGVRTIRVRLNRQHDVPVHSPGRLYYMVRNHFLLMRMPHVPWRWWLPNLVRLVFMLGLFSIRISPRSENFVMMMRGFWDGVLKRSGPYGS